MAVGRAERWEAIRPKAVEVFGEDEDVLRTVAAQIELLEMAWHDVYGEIAPPGQVVEQVLFCSKGRFDRLIRAARLAVRDRRDLQVWADTLRAGPPVAPG